jgi:hypothetical protein
MAITNPLRSLVYRLTESGVALDHIPGLVRNVLQIISDGGLFTTQLVNEQLEQLGWESEVLDETSFQLIVHILESKWGYRVKHHRVEKPKVAVGTDWRRRRLSVMQITNNK